MPGFWTSRMVKRVFIDNNKPEGGKVCMYSTVLKERWEEQDPPGPGFCPLAFGSNVFVREVVSASMLNALCPLLVSNSRRNQFDRLYAPHPPPHFTSRNSDIHTHTRRPRSRPRFWLDRPARPAGRSASDSTPARRCRSRSSG